MLTTATVNRLVDIIVKGSNVSTEASALESLRFMALNDVLLNGLLAVYELKKITFNQLLAELAVRSTAQRILFEHDRDKIKAQLIERINEARGTI